MVVTLPFTLLLLDYWPLGRVASAGGLRASARNLVVEKVPLLALSAASAAITFVAQKSGGAVATVESVGIAQRLAHSIVAYVVYLGMTLWPAGLAPFYHYVRSLPLWMPAVSAAVLVGLSVLLLRAARTRPYLAVGWLWYLGTLVPVIGLVQVGAKRGLTATCTSYRIGDHRFLGRPRCASVTMARTRRAIIPS